MYVCASFSNFTIKFMFRNILFLCNLTILNIVISQAQSNTVFSQTLLGSSFNSYNMGYTIDEINDVVYDVETEQMLMIGRAAHELRDYPYAVPWIAFTKFRPIEEKRNLSASLFGSNFI